ncbi:MAG: hypothetical protein ACRD18_15265 [Terriglobia bacterium]
MSEHSTSTKYFVLALVALAIIVGIYVWAEQHHARRSAAAQQAHAPMTAAEKSYLPEVEVAGPKMSAASNFLGATVYYLDGTLVNKGSQTVRDLDLKLTFMDPFGQVVLLETEHPITRQTAPLKAGSSQALHVIFEHLPAEWNQGPPIITAAYVSFR